MPVRSSNSPVLTWPNRETVNRAVRRWARVLAESRPDVLRVGYFGSYARDDWGVGSDLDIVLILAECDDPPLRRALGFDTITGLPVPVDLLVYTQEEWDRLQAERSSFVLRLAKEAVWVD